MSKARHTPTPWYKPDGSTVIFSGYGTKKETVVGYGTTRNCGPAEAEANVEFIVRACNSHDDLLAACGLQVGLAGDGMYYVCRSNLSRMAGGFSHYSFAIAFIDDLRKAAIAKAEGK